MATVDHRFALTNPSLLNTLSKKIILQSQLTDLCMQNLQVNGRFATCIFTENCGSLFNKLLLLGRGLVGMYPYYSANSQSVVSLATAVSATFALKFAEWFCLVLVAISCSLLTLGKAFIGSRLST